MSLFSSHLELEIDERILFHRGECDDGENQYTVNSPSDNGFLLAAPHVETAVADDDVGGDKERQGNPGNRRNLQLMRQGPVMEGAVKRSRKLPNDGARKTLHSRVTMTKVLAILQILRITCPVLFSILSKRWKLRRPRSMISSTP